MVHCLLSCTHISCQFQSGQTDYIILRCAGIIIAVVKTLLNRADNICTTIVKKDAEIKRTCFLIGAWGLHNPPAIPQLLQSPEEPPETSQGPNSNYGAPLASGTACAHLF